jgi:hypothetical protein
MNSSLFAILNINVLIVDSKREMDQRRYEKERTCDAKVSHAKSNSSLVALTYCSSSGSVMVVVVVVIIEKSQMGVWSL